MRICSRCHGRNRSKGDLCRCCITDQERFWAKVIKTDNHWLWIGTLTQGYGMFHLKGHGMIQAHRVSYEWASGSIPIGVEPDHICRVRRCVRPDHLELVTKRINILRGISFAALNARKTHCLNGHEFIGSNYRINRKGSRVCRLCDRIRSKFKYLLKKNRKAA